MSFTSKDLQFTVPMPFGCRSDCRKEYFGHLSALDGPASNADYFIILPIQAGKYSGRAPFLVFFVP